MLRALAAGEIDHRCRWRPPRWALPSRTRHGGPAHRRRWLPGRRRGAIIRARSWCETTVRSGTIEDLKGRVLAVNALGESRRGRAAHHAARATASRTGATIHVVVDALSEHGGDAGGRQGSISRRWSRRSRSFWRQRGTARALFDRSAAIGPSAASSKRRAAEFLRAPRGARGFLRGLSARLALVPRSRPSRRGGRRGRRASITSHSAAFADHISSPPATITATATRARISPCCRAISCS